MRIVLLALIVLLCSGCGEKPADVLKRRTRALVIENLKAPATAQFGDMAVKQPKDYPKDLWLVSGHVDSQNSFGATIRTSYEVHWMVDGETILLVNAEWKKPSK